MEQSGILSLPEDIIFFEIFARLPIKSLHRFRSVSKFCRSLTSDPPFLDAVRRKGRPNYLLSFSSSMHWQFVLYSIEFELYKYPQIKRIDYTPSPRNHSYVNFINGLMCCARGQRVIVRHIGTNEEFSLPPIFRQSDLDRHFFYFCYDPKKDKYKMLCSTSVRMIGINGEFFVVDMRYSIFTLGVDPSWRYFDRPGLYQLGRSRSVCINGVLFSTSFSTSANKEDGVIAAYDVGKECFHIVKYPEGLSPSRYRSYHLIQVKGAIAIADMGDFERCTIKLWIKGEGFGCEYWMEHRIKFPYQWETIFKQSYNFSFCNNRDGEIILGSSSISTSGCWIFRYNIETRKWRRIDIVGLDRCVILDNFHVEEYVETPLLLRKVLNLN